MIGNTNPWAKAGVMFRDSTAAGAISVAVVATEANGVSLQWRSATGGTCNNIQVGSVGTPTSSSPVWVELVKTGTTYTGYYSTNGTSYTAIGSTTVSLTNSTYLAGLAVTAHDNTQLNTSTFTNLSVTPTAPAQIGIQFQGTGTALLPTDTAGLSSVAETNWNVLAGSSFTNQALSDSSGAITTATLSGSASGVWTGGGSTALPAGNAKLASGELFDTSTTSLTVSNIPYANYDVYVYVGMDAAGRNETISLTPSGGSAQYFSFDTELGGSAWAVATNTWNGTGTVPSLPNANYVHYTNQTASSFTMAWGASGNSGPGNNNGGLNGIQIVPVSTNPAVPVISSASTASGTTGTPFSYTITASNSPTSFNATGLPAGLTVNTATGVISGTPTATGTSTVTLSATNAGGTGTQTLTITVSILTQLSGNNQSAVPDNSLSNPLTVTATDAQGNSLSGVAITFTITSGGGGIGSSPFGAVSSQITVLSGSNGQASVYDILPSTSNTQVTITATIAGGSSVTFTEGSTSSTGTQLTLPTQVVAILLPSGNTQIHWVNNGSTATSIIIERSSDSSTWNIIGSVAPSSTDFTDDTSSGDTYYYRVTAVNSN